MSIMVIKIISQSPMKNMFIYFIALSICYRQTLNLLIFVVLICVLTVSTMITSFSVTIISFFDLFTFNVNSSDKLIGI